MFTFLGFRNTSSQISASYSSDGKYVVCASEDFNVYFWKREPNKVPAPGKKRVANTKAHEHFQCRDVSVAIVWPGVVKGDPPPMPVSNKKNSKRNGGSHSHPNSPTKDDGILGLKRLLPPLPKKNKEKVSTPTDEDPAQVSGVNSSPGDSASHDDSPSDANSSSTKHDDSPSTASASDETPSLSAATGPNSASGRKGDTPSLSAATGPNSASGRKGDTPSLSAATGPGSASGRKGDSPSISAGTASASQGEPPSISAATGPNSASGRHDDLAAGDPNSASTRHGDPSSLSASDPHSTSGRQGDGSFSVQTTAWGMVIVTATVGGQIRSYQNFGLPRRVGHKGNLF